VTMIEYEDPAHQQAWENYTTWIQQQAEALRDRGWTHEDALDRCAKHGPDDFTWPLRAQHLVDQGCDWHEVVDALGLNKAAEVQRREQELEEKNKRQHDSITRQAAANTRLQNANEELLEENEQLKSEVHASVPYRGVTARCPGLPGRAVRFRRAAVHSRRAAVQCADRR
jgi:hypothetical protein